jgi:guanyl-specific ribonuclease Sa
MRRNRSSWVVAALVVVALWAWTRQADNGALRAPQTASPPAPAPARATGPAAARPAFLPPEADAVLEAIADGGPYAYRQDGNVFQNREGRLPRRSRGYYREFTVPTPRSPDRGARRIITGGDPPVEYFYSDDHYRSFHRFEPGRGRP